MRFCRRMAGLALVIAVAGCATGYHAHGFDGGFSSTVLSNDIFRISFSGNAYTSPERASDFALLRAAEQSLELGCRYFGVMSEHDQRHMGSISFSQLGWGRGHSWGFSNTIPQVKPDTSLLIRCTALRQPGLDLFDARFVAASIRRKYGMPQRQPAESGAVPPVTDGRPRHDISPPLPDLHGALSVDRPPPSVLAERMESPSISPAATGLAAYAAMVAAAQQVSSQLGCGRVQPVAAASFQARCESWDVLIACDETQCRPLHVIAAH